MIFPSHSFNNLKNYYTEHKISLESTDLPDDIDSVGNSILNEILGCAHEGKCKDQCTIAFKITPRELKFYKTENIPLPQLCPNCRHYQRMKNNNPIRFYERKCMCAGKESENKNYKNIAEHFHKDNHCPNEFETSYDPNRKETIYCESCYNSEVA